MSKHKLSSTIEKSISSIVKSFTDDEKNEDNSINVPIDILRVIKDESLLLYEKQMVLDTFDLDPHGIGWKFEDDAAEEEEEEEDDDENNGDSLLRTKIEQILNDLTVKSCRRTISRDGSNNNDTIEAFIEINKQDWMNQEDIQNYIQFKFLYQRYKNKNNSVLEEEVEDGVNNDKKRKYRDEEVNSKTMDQTQHCDADSNEALDGTIVRYSIEISKDYQKFKNVLSLQISSKHPYPILSEEEDVEDDKYDVNISEEVVLNALHWMNCDGINVYSFLLVLMTFPFYETEWNLMECLLGDDSDMDDDGGSIGSGCEFIDVSSSRSNCESSSDDVST